MNERTFFEYEDVKVTNSRFISGGQTYVMSNVTLVMPFEQKTARLGGILVLLFGLFAMSVNIILGGAIAAVAAHYLYQQKTVFHILLSTSAGETKALVAFQRDNLKNVLNALNEAIVSRG